ncbi:MULTISPECIES: polyphosphate kinase 2 [Rhizobium/Agrobacterium group]|uniref:ADP/GDP-polyphosphate phosphotransferase n=1 Tax=Neorhizobium petrolearium TaxID=515361 RepID=A0ABY8M294_9HYPH|nr:MULTISPECIES: polyphosphate kinase 2 [Rhizobium/Agrobacterium group]KGD86403.1 UDP-galactose-lipid carrier transferase [Rhizobium sp. YS-1r]MCC2608343.1 polyphosphate kinase 2 [Neorhizobium petrolearium]WGI68622.1 polyphosphate kinase 2 [Neorhizobium petrolearium]
MVDVTGSRAVDLRIGDKIRRFDIDDPKLPDWVEDNALGSGRYPYDDKMDEDKYEKQLEKLQIELVKVQFWLKSTGKRLMALFEGRDAAGKGGTIFSIHAYLNPRSARVVALSKPTETEAGQWYFQRYIAHFPTSGEIVLFDRSWYNRAGVEPVMGFCTPEQYKDFMKAVPRFEDTIFDEGIIFFKFYLDIGREMQLKRFHERRHDPLKIWKLSPMDIAALNKWDDYTEKRDAMLEKTHEKETPWTIVRANDKRRARINVIRHMLQSLDYDGKDKSAIDEVDDKILGFGPKFLK